MTIFKPNQNIEILTSDMIPPGTTELDLRGCINLKQLLGPLPAGLTKLDFGGSGLRQLLGPLPAGLTKLNFHGCIDLQQLLGPLPAGLTELDFGGCCRLPQLPEPLPAGLTKLNLRGCESIPQLLEPLPAGLTELDLSGCRLRQLPEPLPAGLTKLDLSGCISLQQLPERFPAGLNKLDLRGCTSLRNTPALIAQLQELEERNRDNPRFQLYWPEHINRNPALSQIKQDIIDAYKQYYDYEGCPLRGIEPNVANVNYPTLTLIHRFMSESVGQRGGIEKITNSMIGVTSYIRDHPEIFRFIDQASHSYLDACVNQPVAGFTQIANLIEIAKQDDISSRLEKAKVIMVLEKIKEEVGKIGVGRNVEVELGNAMTMRVHQKLLKEGFIQEPWPGIPDGVAYEVAVMNCLTDDNVSEISDKVKEFLESLTSDRMIDMVCEGSLQDFWARITLSKEEFDDLNKDLDECKKDFNELVEISDEQVRTLKELEEKTRKNIMIVSKEKTLSFINSIEITEDGASTSNSGSGPVANVTRPRSSAVSSALAVASSSSSQVMPER